MLVTYVWNLEHCLPSKTIFYHIDESASKIILFTFKFIIGKFFIPTSALNFRFLIEKNKKKKIRWMSAATGGDIAKHNQYQFKT